MRYNRHDLNYLEGDRMGANEISMETKVKLKGVTNRPFLMALKELSNMELWGRASFVVSDINSKVESYLEEYDSSRVKALKKYVKLDEKGEIVRDEKGNVIWNEPTSEATFIAELNDLLEQEVDLVKVSFEALIKTQKDDFKIKSSILTALRDIIYKS